MISTFSPICRRVLLNNTHISWNNRKNECVALAKQAADTIMQQSRSFGSCPLAKRACERASLAKIAASKHATSDQMYLQNMKLSQFHIQKAQSILQDLERRNAFAVK